MRFAQESAEAMAVPWPTCRHPAMKFRLPRPEASGRGRGDFAFAKQKTAVVRPSRQRRDEMRRITSCTAAAQQAGVAGYRRCGRAHRRARPADQLCRHDQRRHCGCSMGAREQPGFTSRANPRSTRSAALLVRQVRVVLKMFAGRGRPQCKTPY